MIIHTLGPKTTDSYNAAQYLIKQNQQYQNAQIILHPSFEEIYQNLFLLKNEFFLVPVAYKSATNNDNWGSNNYRFWQQLRIKDTFVLPTMPMVLVKNLKQNNHKIILHASTNELAEEFETSISQKLSHKFVTSKPLALTEFNSGNYQYAIYSKKQFIKDPTTKIIRTFQPDMIWCLYQIK